MSDLAALRQKIDSLDTTLVNILNERARVSLDIGAAKRRDTQVFVFLLNASSVDFYKFISKAEEVAKEDVQVFRPGREKEIYKKVTSKLT